MSGAARACLAVGLVAILAAGAGCGGTVIDDAKAEAAVKDDIETKLDVKVRSVQCPSDVDVEAGATFECLVTAKGGQRARATLKILNADADVSFIDLKAVK